MKPPFSLIFRFSLLALLLLWALSWASDKAWANLDCSVSSTEVQSRQLLRPWNAPPYSLCMYSQQAQQNCSFLYFGVDEQNTNALCSGLPLDQCKVAFWLGEGVACTNQQDYLIRPPEVRAEELPSIGQIGANFYYQNNTQQNLSSRDHLSKWFSPASDFIRVSFQFRNNTTRNRGQWGWEPFLTIGDGQTRNRIGIIRTENGGLRARITQGSFISWDNTLSSGSTGSNHFINANQWHDIEITTTTANAPFFYISVYVDGVEVINYSADQSRAPISSFERITYVGHFPGYGSHDFRNLTVHTFAPEFSETFDPESQLNTWQSIQIENDKAPWLGSDGQPIIDDSPTRYRAPGSDRGFLGDSDRNFQIDPNTGQIISGGGLNNVERRQPSFNEFSFNRNAPFWEEGFFSLGDYSLISIFEDFLEKMSSSTLYQFLAGFLNIALPPANPNDFVFSFDLSGLIGFEGQGQEPFLIAPPSYIWNFIYLLIMLSALLTARKIVFGG